MQSPLSYAFSSVLSNKGCLSSLDTALSKNRYPHHSHLASVRERAGQGLQASTSLLHCCQCLQPWTHFGFYFQLCHHQHAGPLGDVPIICANTYTPLLSSLCILQEFLKISCQLRFPLFCCCCFEQGCVFQNCSFKKHVSLFSRFGAEQLEMGS